MRIVTEYRATDHGQTHQIHIGESDKTLDPTQARLQLRQAILYAAKMLEGVDPGTPYEKLTHSGPSALKRTADCILRNALPFKEASRLLYELGEAGKVKDYGPERHTLILDMIAGEIWQQNTSYNTRDR